MSKKLAELFGTMAEGLEGAAAAARELEAGYSMAAAKSGSEAVDDVASSTASPRGKKGAVAAPVATKSAKGGKAKAPTVTFEELKEKLTALVNLKGKEVVRTVLSDFGIAKLVELEEDNYVDFAAKIDEVTAAEDDVAAEDPDDMFGA